MGGTVTFLCPSALYNFCYQAGVTLFVLSFINYYGVECLFINLQGQVRCSKCRHIGWGCADLSLTESAGWFRWNQWQLKSADGELIEQLSLWAHTQTSKWMASWWFVWNTLPHNALKTICSKNWILPPTLNMYWIYLNSLSFIYHKIK